MLFSKDFSPPPQGRLYSADEKGAEIEIGLFPSWQVNGLVEELWKNCGRIGLKIIKVRLGKVVKLALGTKKTQRGKRIAGV